MATANLFGSNDDESHTKISFFRDRHWPLYSVVACRVRPKKTGGLLLVGARRWPAPRSGIGSGKLAAVAIGTPRRCGTRQRSGPLFDRADRLEMSAAAKAAQHAPIGSQFAGKNPSSGNYGSITPRREGRHRRSSAVCREFSNSLTIDGQTEEYVGVACRARDGSWNFQVTRQSVVSRPGFSRPIISQKLALCSKDPQSGFFERADQIARNEIVVIGLVKGHRKSSQQGVIIRSVADLH